MVAKLYYESGYPWVLWEWLQYGKYLHASECLVSNWGLPHSADIEHRHVPFCQFVWPIYKVVGYSIIELLERLLHQIMWPTDQIEGNSTYDGNSCFAWLYLALLGYQGRRSKCIQRGLLCFASYCWMFKPRWLGDRYAKYAQMHGQKYQAPCSLLKNKSLKRIGCWVHQRKISPTCNFFSQTVTQSIRPAKYAVQVQQLIKKCIC